MKNIVFFTGILGVSLFVLAAILGAEQIEGYNMISQYISESCATGLPNAQYLRNMYIASGMSLALFGFMTPFFMPRSVGVKIGFFLFAVFYGFGTVVTGFFPCDIGCNPDVETASLSQFVHNTMGFLSYAVVPLCLVVIGISSRKLSSTTDFTKISIRCGIVSFVFVLLLFGNSTGPFIGLFQRVVEGSILFWVGIIAFKLWTSGVKIPKEADR